MPLASTKPSQSRQTKSFNTSALQDNTNTSPSSRFQRSSTPLPVWPTHCKSTSTTTTSRPTDANTSPNSKQSPANQSSRRDQSPLLKPHQNKRRLPLQRPLLPSLLKAQPLTSLISLAQSKISNNQWLKILPSNTRSKQANLSLKSMLNPEPTLPSKQLSRRILLVLLSNSWRLLLLSSNHSSLVLDLAVMAPSLSNRSNHNRQASPRILSTQLSNNPSKARRHNNSNSHNSCNKRLSQCSNSNKIPLPCNSSSNPHKCNLRHNRSSHKQLTHSANQ